MEPVKRPLFEVLGDLWTNGPQGRDWLLYTVAGILLVKLIRYIIQVLKING